VGTYTTTSDSTVALGDNWLPILGIPEYNGSFAGTNMLSNVIQNPYNATKVRVVGIGWRINYSGTAANANGLVIAKDVPFGIDLDQFIVPTNVAFKVNAAGTTIGNLPFATTCYRMDIGLNPVNTMAHAASCHISANPWGILRHNSPVYKWMEYHEQGAINCLNTVKAADIVAGVTSSVMAIYRDFPNGQNSGMNMWDDTFSCTELQITAVSASISFRIEVKFCCEYLLPAASPVYSLTKAPPKAEPQLIRQADETISKMPTLLPYNEPR